MEIDYSILKDYSAFEKANKNNWNILSYISFKYDIDAALAFSKFLFPDFVTYRDCLILSFLFKKETCDAWFNTPSNNIITIEKMCNLFEVRDFFYVNRDINDTKMDLKLDYLSKMLKYAWQTHLNQLFPEQYVVDIFFEETYYITIYSRFEPDGE